jgi:molybdopterin-guanine dinucleotide biosynthesis protein A
VTQTCSCFVLAGGKSSRFGANKSLALVGSQPMALVVANNLQTAFGSAARLVGSDAQTSNQIGLVSISGPREGNGPLAAIIDAMEAAQILSLLLHRMTPRSFLPTIFRHFLQRLNSQDLMPWWWWMT